MSNNLDPARLERVLDYLGADLEPSILIGGWATNYLVGGEISMDVDLIVGSPELKSRLRSTLDEFSENQIHSGGKKLRGTLDSVHVDAYLPYESRLGRRLQLDVAKLAENVGPEAIKGWRLLTLEAHLLTKFAALLDRPDTEKGGKDAREIVALLNRGVDLEELVRVLLQSSSLDVQDLPRLIEEVFELFPPRASANKQLRKVFANQRREVLDLLRRRIRQIPAAEN